MKTLLIIPAYNEEECILNTVNSIKNSKLDVDYIVINDGSKDKTEEILKNNNINHIELIHNLGIGGAVQTGYKYAYENDYDIAVQFDADGQHDIKSLKTIIDPVIDEKYDMVIGSRFIEKTNGFKSSSSRRLGINIISFFIKLFTGKKIYDVTSGYRAVNKKIIKDFANSYPIEFPEPVTNTEMIKKNYKIKEVSVIMKERAGGVSSITSWKSAYFMINVILSIFIVSIRRYK